MRKSPRPKLAEARYNPEALAVGEQAVIAAAENRKPPVQAPVTPGVAAIEQEVEGEKSIQDRYQEALDTLTRLRALPHNERDDIGGAMKIVKDSAARAATLLPEEGEVIAEGLNQALADVTVGCKPETSGTMSSSHLS